MPLALSTECPRNPGYQANVPLEPGLVDRYGIAATPTFVMFENGREVGRANPEISAFGIRRDQ
jgi:hypothetical protein